MDEREDELARLLEHARGDLPSAQLLDEVRARLLSAAASSAPAAATVPSAIAPAAQVTLVVKLGLGALALGVVTTAYFVQLGAHQPAPVTKPAAKIAVPAPAIEPAPTLEVGPAPEPPRTDPPVAAPRRAARRVDKASVALSAAPEPPPEPAAPAAKSAFAEELSLIKAALAAQRAGRVAEAREKLAEHARRFPEGQLKSERARIEARLKR